MKNRPRVATVEIDSKDWVLVQARGFGLLCALVVVAVIPVAAQQSLTSDGLRSIQADGRSLTLIDVRTPIDFQRSHIAGAVNIQSDLLLKANLQKTDRIVLYCGSPTCGLSHAAAKVLASDGYSNVAVLEGGIAAWQEKSYPVVAPPAQAPLPPMSNIAPGELSRKIKDGSVTVIDVRPSSEFRAGHLPGAVNISLETLSSTSSGLDSRKQMVVYDRVASRSLEAARTLQAAGFKVLNLSGGISVWAALKLPIEM